MPTRGVLKHAAETQLARGGLYVAVDASALPPLVRADAAAVRRRGGRSRCRRG